MTVRAAALAGVLAAAVLTASGLPGCASGDRPELTVLAAASLADAFGELRAGFEASHPGVEVRLAFAGSQTLSAWVRHGIAADVVASADLAHVEALHAEGLVAPPRPFAGNSLVLAVPAGAPEIDLAGLAAAERLVVGAPEVPVGRYAAALLDAAAARWGDGWRERVEGRIVSREPDARLAVAKVAMGEADAAIVYATDAAATPGVRAVPLPEDLAPIATYHHARVTAAPAPDLARAWMAYVEGAEGRAGLERRGFRPPPGGPPPHARAGVSPATGR